MSEQSVFFKTFNFEQTSSVELDQHLQSAKPSQLVCVFLWGHDCPNCEIAKNVLVEYQDSIKSLNMKWYHANIYDDFDLARRFGLFGIPVFLFFRNEKKLGKISPFPGFDPFYEAVQKLTQS